MYDSKNIAYVLTSLEAIEKLLIYTEGIQTAKDFLERSDQLVYNACLTLLMTIGEEVNKIDVDLKEEYPHIPWQSIKGMRNRIAHDYRGLDPTIPYSIIKQFLSPLKECFTSMIVKIDYPKAKLNKVLDSTYYKHIRYLKKE